MLASACEHQQVEHAKMKCWVKVCLPTPTTTGKEIISPKGLKQALGGYGLLKYLPITMTSYNTLLAKRGAGCMASIGHHPVMAQLLLRRGSREARPWYLLGSTLPQAWPN